MRLLLDSHTFVWMMIAPEALGKKAVNLLSDNTNQLSVSAVSLWELVVKESLGKLRVPKGALGLFRVAQERGMILFLGIDPLHLEQLAKLPNHHRDPFDRLLIAQAISEDLSIVTKDPEFKRYRVRCVW